MNLDSPERLELAELADALVEQSLTAEQARRLQQLTHDSPQALTFFRQYLELSGELAWVSGSADLDSTAVSQSAVNEEISLAPSPSRPIWAPLRRGVHYLSTPGRFSLVAATVTCVSFLLFFAQIQWSPFHVTTAHVLAHPNVPVARLLPIRDCRWEGAPPTDETLLPGSMLHLADGVAEIQFLQGARVRLEGLTMLRLEQANGGRLVLGQIAVQAPPSARGFTIDTPSMKIVDLGTEFSVVVDREQTSAVYVHAGKVQIRALRGADSANAHDLAAGEARQVDVEGRQLPIATVMSARLKSNYAPQESLEDTLRHDTGLLVYYGPASIDALPTIKNLARTGAVNDGRLVGGERKAGGDGLTGARLSLTDAQDGVAFDLPDTLNALTLATSIRIAPASQSPGLTSLLTSDGWGRNGLVHWQIQRNAPVGLTFCVYGSPIYVAPLPLAQVTDRWVHLAVTYDVARGRVAQYVDAERIAEATNPQLPAARIGAASWGNWFPGGPGQPGSGRNVIGELAEFMLFRRVLTAGEIEYLYRHGASGPQTQATSAELKNSATAHAPTLQP